MPDDFTGRSPGSKILPRDVSLGFNWSLLSFLFSKIWGCSEQKEICVWFTKWLACYGSQESLGVRRNALLNLCCCPIQAQGSSWKALASPSLSTRESKGKTSAPSTKQPVAARDFIMSRVMLTKLSANRMKADTLHLFTQLNCLEPHAALWRPQ